MKPIVNFIQHKNNIIVVGVSALVEAINHPRLGAELVRTSAVLSINDNGSFETRNSIYVPVELEEEED